MGVYSGSSTCGGLIHVFAAKSTELAYLRVLSAKVRGRYRSQNALRTSLEPWQTMGVCVNIHSKEFRGGAASAMVHSGSSLCRGLNSDFHLKTDQNGISAPPQRCAPEALWNVKHPANVTRTMANHGSLCKGTVLGVRNRSGVMRAHQVLPSLRSLERVFSTKNA